MAPRTKWLHEQKEMAKTRGPAGTIAEFGNRLPNVLAGSDRVNFYFLNSAGFSGNNTGVSLIQPPQPEGNMTLCPAILSGFSPDYF